MSHHNGPTWVEKPIWISLNVIYYLKYLHRRWTGPSATKKFHLPYKILKTQTEFYGNNFQFETSSEFILIRSIDFNIPGREKKIIIKKKNKKNKKQGLWPQNSTSKLLIFKLLWRAFYWADHGLGIQSLCLNEIYHPGYSRDLRTMPLAPKKSLSIKKSKNPKGVLRDQFFIWYQFWICLGEIYCSS